MIKVLSNNNYTIQKLGTRYTQTLQRIRIRPFVPEQRMPDVTVRANEYFHDPDVKVSHNEWYAVSWEMDFGKQIEQYEQPANVERNQHVDIQEVTNTNDETMSPQMPTNYIEGTNDVAWPSPDFSNLTTDVGDNPYIRRPHPLEVHLFPQDHRL